MFIPYGLPREGGRAARALAAGPWPEAGGQHSEVSIRTIRTIRTIVFRDRSSRIHMIYNTFSVD